MKVSEIMTAGVELVPADATVREAATAMAEHDIGAVLVGTEEQLLGVLTDRDIILRVVIPGEDTEQRRTGEVMSSTLFTCRPDDTLEAALRAMDEHQVRRMPVVDEAGHLLGIVARSDLTRALIKQGQGEPTAAPLSPPEAGAPEPPARQG